MKTYSKYISKSIFGLLGWVIIAIGFAYIAFSIAQSIVASILIFVATIFIWRHLFGGNAIRKKIINRVFFDKNRAYKDACYPWDDESLGWVKGVGYIDSINQPMWIKGTPEGLILYFFCNARKLPFLVPWSHFSHISLDKRDNVSRELYAKLYLLNNGHRIRFPWCLEFNDLIPVTVGLTI